MDVLTFYPRLADGTTVTFVPVNVRNSTDISETIHTIFGTYAEAVEIEVYQGDEHVVSFSRETVG